MEFLIVSGLSGAGKSTVMSVLEDSGFFCVDNLPPLLIPKFAELCLAGTGTYERVAMACDIRGGENFDGLFEALDSLKEMQFEYRILFVEADTKTIIKRYQETRRSHPLMAADGVNLVQAVERERKAMEAVRQRADYVIDTTDMLPQKLRSTIRGLFATGSERKGLAVTVYSFGFKHGAPYDADLVMDVRFLPNPYYDPELRPLTGLDAPVRDFVRMREETIEFEQKWHDLLDVVMPGYVAEGKQQLAIGVGCTGGQHRSVALAEATGDYLKSKGYRVSVAHRDLRLAERGHDVQRESDNVLDARAGGGKEA